MKPDAVNLRERLGRFVELWSPKVVAEFEGFHFKVAKLEGDFVWHAHADTDEAFLVIQGRLRIDFRDGNASLGEGDLLVVPRGVEHKPFAAEECHVMILAREGTVNTGDAPPSHLTSDPMATL